MRFGPAAPARLLLVLALILPGCGEQETAATGAATTVSDAKAAGRASPSVDRPNPRALATARRCRDSLGEFLDAMESLNNTVAVGLDYDGYLTMVNRVRASYAEIDAERLPLLCLAKVASPAESALNSYIAAANAWGECLATTSCDLAEVEPALQRRWAGASDLVGETQTGLRALSSS